MINAGGYLRLPTFSSVVHIGLLELLVSLIKKAAGDHRPQHSGANNQADAILLNDLLLQYQHMEAGIVYMLQQLRACCRIFHAMHLFTGTIHLASTRWEISLVGPIFWPVKKTFHFRSKKTLSLQPSSALLMWFRWNVAIIVSNFMTWTTLCSDGDDCGTISTQKWRHNEHCVERFGEFLIHYFLKIGNALLFLHHRCV